MASAPTIRIFATADFSNMRTPEQLSCQARKVAMFCWFLLTWVTGPDRRVFRTVPGWNAVGVECSAAWRNASAATRRRHEGIFVDVDLRVRPAVGDDVE